ncbi:two-component system regulatory protein YycI [Metasolibacillus sp. FSL H7-0170]|uniref:two-component system regulatory protein YycI n=1 Tax=Metasolibacillus TaxID=2703677 RepID=UPI00079402EA|nr:two-component system regulatory protein YycI [Metasolibacillus fluoroglycofenilyticus]KYG89839.1 transcriptional regulator [[Bacillus] sp. KCTC 13219]
MDWNKTKSIFIFVFLILNIFLYSQYVKNYKENQNVEVLGEKNIEAKLKDDNITYAALPNNVEKAAYISGKVKLFNTSDALQGINEMYRVEDEDTLIVTFQKPIKLRNMEQSGFQEFIQQYINAGASYTLWDINREEGTAIYFQRMNDRTLYYSLKGLVKVYFTEQGEVYKYEQTMLEQLGELEQQKNLLPPIQIIQVLYARNFIKPNSHITSMKLGYSTLFQFTQTQVFAPTWEVRVQTQEGTSEEFFVNAVEGKVVDMQLDVKAVEEEE